MTAAIHAPDPRAVVRALLAEAAVAPDLAAAGDVLKRLEALTEPAREVVRALDRATDAAGGFHEIDHGFDAYHAVRELSPVGAALVLEVLDWPTAEGDGR